MSLVYPVPPAYKDRINYAFGSNAWDNTNFPWQYGVGHWGVDYGVPEGTPVYAIADGVVLHADWGEKLKDNGIEYLENLPDDASAPGGICVYIDHTAAAGTGTPWSTCYAHLSRTDLNRGDLVKRGQLLGYSGTTGRSSGPHLHFECILNGYGQVCNLPAGIIWGRYNGILQVDAENRRFGSAPAAATAPAAPRSIPNARFVIGPSVANVRNGTIPSAVVTRTLPAGGQATVKAWKHGMKPAGAHSDVWFQLNQSKRADGGPEWVHSSIFKSSSTAGLREVK